MSAATARAARPAVRVAAPAGRTLRLVSARRSTAARAPFVAVVVVTLSAGLLALLLLNTVLAQDAFRLHLLQVQGRLISDQEQGLQREVESLQSPAMLAARAAALGMVPGGPPAFLRLSDGKVLGAPAPGAGAPAGSGPAVPGAPASGAPALAGAAATHGAQAAAGGGWVLVPSGHAAAGQQGRPGQPGGGPAGAKPAAQPSAHQAQARQTAPRQTAPRRTAARPARSTTTSGAHR